MTLADVVANYWADIQATIDEVAARIDTEEEQRRRRLLFAYWNTPLPLDVFDWDLDNWDQFRWGP